MTTLPIRHQYHAAALALNNTGISLLQRRCYRQAIQVLKESVDVMKTVSLLSPQEQLEASKQQHLELAASSNWPRVQELLRNSSQALFHPEPDVQNNLSATSCIMNLQVVSLDESAFAVQQVLKKTDQETSALDAFLIRIDSSEMNSSCGPSADNLHLFDVHASIILYNFGISYRCMASVAPDVAEEILKNAFSLSELSFALFHGNFWRLESTQDFGLWAEFLPLAIIFLQNLEDLAFCIGKESDAQNIRLKLAEAIEIFVDRQLQLAGVSQRITASAA